MYEFFSVAIYNEIFLFYNLILKLCFSLIASFYSQINYQIIKKVLRRVIIETKGTKVWKTNWWRFKKWVKMFTLVLLLYKYSILVPQYFKILIVVQKFIFQFLIERGERKRLEFGGWESLVWHRFWPWKI